MADIVNASENAVIHIWLSLMGKPNYRISEMITSSCGGLRNAWDMSEKRHVPDEIQKNRRLAERFTDPSQRERALDIYRQCERKGIGAVFPDSDGYPDLLKEIINRPSVLYYAGRLPCDAGKDGYAMLSVVGSRRCTPYGRTNAYGISRELALAGIGIVSGMARGIDSEAHRGALSAGGYTLAVLGSGTDIIYPPENARLYSEILEKGCVISEYPPGTQPYRSNFPARNRIISGISAGTLVIEAARSSGAMITVDRAIEQNRNVYAVPGNITSESSQGCNSLIRSGVVCVTSHNDILADMNIESRERECGWINGLYGAEAACASAINRGYYTVNDIVRYADMSITDILSALTMLEIKCIVSKAEDGTYRLV